MLYDTVDGRKPAPPGMHKNLRTNGINYQPQLVSRISSINRISSIKIHKSISYDMSLCIFWGSNIACLDITSTNWTPSPPALNGRVTCHLSASMRVTHDMQSPSPAKLVEKNKRNYTDPHGIPASYIHIL